EYIASNPASSFRSLHESIVNYGGNRKPEFLTCMHEESSVAMAHGYAKAAGKPMGVLAHGSVGLQHAAMAVYHAWCDRVPVVIIADGMLQEHPVDEDAKLGIPRLTLSAPPQGESGALKEAAKLLAAADSLVIIADRAARSQEGVRRMVELAEALNAPVVDLGDRKSVV